MATTIELSDAAARAGTLAANSLQEGDEFPGASGAAKIAGFYDDPKASRHFHNCIQSHMENPQGGRARTR